jgi:hypothetical protein
MLPRLAFLVAAAFLAAARRFLVAAAFRPATRSFFIRTALRAVRFRLRERPPATARRFRALAIVASTAVLNTRGGLPGYSACGTFIGCSATVDRVRLQPELNVRRE